MHPSRLLLLSLLATGPAVAAENVAIVLDASGSMWGQIDGRSKIEIAREAVAGIVADWEPDNHIALVAYGHTRKGDCGDIQTLIPLGPLDAGTFMAQVNALNPKGMTPLSQATITAAQALRASEQKATVVLVSDGEETCDMDPCAVGAELARSGVDFTAHVIGFDVNDPTHQAQLRCLAENTGGRYFNARDAGELGTAIRGAVQASTAAEALPPANASLEPKGSARITLPLEVEWSGPADARDYIAVAQPDADEHRYIHYTNVPESPEQQARGQLALMMPAEAGSYELRYVSPDRTPSVLARHALQVGDAEARLEAPDTAMAGEQIRVIAEGPEGPRHWVGFVQAGADTAAYITNHYSRLSGPRSELRLKVPATPGDYELRYVLNEGERVIASRPIRVEPAKASVSGPAEVMAGDRITIQAQGPAHGSHWIGVAPAGGDAGSYVSNGYARPQGAQSSVTVTAPLEPGAYEYRYVLYEAAAVVASQPLTVQPARAHLEVQASHVAGSQVVVGFSGPRGNGHWIGFVPVGGDGSSYEDWAYVPKQGDSLTLRAPAEVGDWELIYHMGGQVIARQPVRVTAP